MLRMTKFRRFLKKNGLGPVAISKRAGVSLRHVQYLLAGETSPSLKKALAIQDACTIELGRTVPLDELFDLSELRRRAS